MCYKFLFFIYNKLRYNENRKDDSTMNIIVNGKAVELEEGSRALEAAKAHSPELYKAALDEIMDWAVEIPAYQRQNIVIASSEGVDTATVTGDVTTYWGWLAELETMKMVEAAQ